jgi:3-oxoacyl-[acyl-carrier-protein] synthase III
MENDVVSRRRLVIAGTGHYVPENAVTNHDLARIFDTSDALIREKTGVRERRHAAPDETLADMCKVAFDRALLDAGLRSEDIDLLIVNSLSPDYHDPSQACLIQPLLGLRHVPAFDIRAQTSGLLYGLDIAAQYIGAGAVKNAVIICGELLSKRIDQSNEGRNFGVLLADGAAAVIVRGSEEKDGDSGLIDLDIGADGVHFELLHTVAPGVKAQSFRVSDDFDDGLYQFKTNARAMFHHACDTMERAAKKMLEKHKLTIDDVHILLAAQPTLRVLEEVRERLGCPSSRCHVNVDVLGNMESASLPISLALARRSERMRRGAIALLITYGAGATWGSALYRS